MARSLIWWGFRGIWSWGVMGRIGELVPYGSPIKAIVLVLVASIEF